MSTTHTYTTPHPYFATYPIPIHTTPEHSVTPRDTTRSYPFVTLSTSTSIYTTTPSSLFTDSTVNFTFISNDTTVTPIHSYDITGAETTTPSSPYYMDDVIKPTETNYFEDVISPSGTIPYTDVTMSSGGDVIIPSGTVPYGTDVTMPIGTMPYDDDITVMIPTVPRDDIIGMTTVDWPEITEYISVSSIVPTTTTVGPTTELMTEQMTAKPPTTTTTKKPMWPLSRQEETSENNSIDVLYNQIIGVDNVIPQNNLIHRRSRVFLRERTRNKRIQELLEEKRNFLLRMKRAQSGAA